MNIRRNILGGILGSFDEDEFEKETPLLSTVTQGVGGIFADILSLGQDVAGVEAKTQSNENGKFPTTGTIEFTKKQMETEEKQKTETDRKKAFYQTLKEDQERARRAKEQLLFEEEMDDIVTNLPTEQKNRLLHYQASYRDRSIYQRAELRKKLIEERKRDEKQQKEASVPSPAKQPNSLEVAFEGASGSKGNLSFQAVG
ncbi:MAG: hypothetical protein PHE48_03120 [Candidatus Daviesbacteria bacterium]|nr:hypothetical protein [Candidatus Daviesbacteria bacterium]